MNDKPGRPRTDSKHYGVILPNHIHVWVKQNGGSAMVRQLITDHKRQMEKTANDSPRTS